MSQKEFIGSVAHQLFNRPWLCQIQEMYRMPDNQLRVVGYHTTGDKQWDKELMKNWVTCYLTIVQMVVLHSRGAGIVINNPADAADIYKLIFKHLETWKIIVERSLNNANPPLDDLRLMDDFASSIYEVARPYMETDSPITGLMANLGMLGGLKKLTDDGKGLTPKRITGIKRRRMEAEKESEQKITTTVSGFDLQDSGNTPDVIPESKHNPVSDAIAKSMHKRFGQWPS